LWVFQELLADDGVAGDHFGFSIGISDHSIVIGAPDAAITPYLKGTGVVYSFEREEYVVYNDRVSLFLGIFTSFLFRLYSSSFSLFIQVQKMWAIGDTLPLDRYGRAVAISKHAYIAGMHEV
jgi:hypothetical protein